MEGKKNRLKFVMTGALVFSFLLAGCSGESDQKDKGNEAVEILKKAEKKFDTYQSYEETSIDSGKIVTEEKGKLVTMNLDESSTAMIGEIVLKDGTRYKSYTGVDMNGFKFNNTQKNTKTATEVIFRKYDEKGREVDGSYFKQDEEIKTFNTIKEHFDFLITGENADYFTLSSKKDGDYTLVTATCKDLAGYQKKQNEGYKESNSDYDPLTIQGIIVSKNEMKKYEQTLKIDSNGNAVELTTHDIIDYGDELEKDCISTIKFSKFNEVTLNTEDIDQRLKSAADVAED